MVVIWQKMYLVISKIAMLIWTIEGESDQLFGRKILVYILLLV